MEYKVFEEIDNVELNGSVLNDGEHINEIFNVIDSGSGLDGLFCVFNLNQIKKIQHNYIQFLYSKSIRINGLIYYINIKYITINEENNQLLIYYNIH